MKWININGKGNAKMDKLIFATTNKGKMKEIKSILSELNLEILSLEEAGINVNVVEDGITFEENAKIKAVEVAKLTGGIVLADDSGLEIDYLDKAPGVYSARFMGEDTPYDVKNQAIINKLMNVPDDKRTARFVCAIAAVFPNGDVEVTKGTMEGMVAHEIKGENGFGYDPIFFLQELGCTNAELSPDEKNKISHRGKALRMMLNVLKTRI